MIKNDDNNKGGLGSELYNNSLDFSSNTPTSQKKVRKDAKGNLILKKKFPVKKTKYHAYFIDSINKNKNLVNLIEIESYKKYNLDEPVEEEQENTKEEEKLEESKDIVSQKCCYIF